jgi:hypothetical protein
VLVNKECKALFPDFNKVLVQQRVARDGPLPT